MTASRRGPRSRRRHRWLHPWSVAGVLAALALASVPTGAAPRQTRSLTTEEAAALASRAVDDDDALARLGAVERVEGAPVDLRAVLSDLGASERRDRLKALAGQLGRRSGADAPVDPAQARARAGDVLAGDEYQQRDVPRPFRGALRWLADRLAPGGRFLERVLRPFGALLAFLPRGVLLGVTAVALGAAAWWLAQRRSKTSLEDPGRHGRHGRLVDPDLDPVDLDERAEAAETAGDLDAAVRLRYQSGLLRLARAGRLRLQADTTASDAARQVGGATVDRLTVDFEAIAYGGRPATGDDVSRARASWPEVLGERSRR